MKIGASHLASEDIPFEESLEIFESMDKIEYFEITHERPFREISDDKDMIDLINSYELKYTIHSAYTDLNIASFNKAIQKASINEIERSIDFAVDIDSASTLESYPIPHEIKWTSSIHLEGIL